MPAVEIKMIYVSTLLVLFGVNRPCFAFQRPNIVFILADDMGWNDIGFHGSDIKTPSLDTLAYEGVILNNYYVSPICTPTRGALMTGRYPIHTGLQHDVILAPQPYGLPLNHTTMAEYLKTLGYATHIIGKWHLGFFKKEYLPTNRGFDSHYGYWTGHEDYFTHENNVIYTGFDFRRNDNLLWNTTGQYSTELFTQEAERLIKEHDTSKPLFLYMAHQAVHAGNDYAPLQAPQSYIDRCEYISDQRRRVFAAMVTALDDSVANITRALTDKGMVNNTIIVFSTDNGGGPAHKYVNNVACNYPLRGTKDTLWEGGVRGVGFMYSNLLKSRGKVSQNLMHVTDWLPTLYKAAGGNVEDLSTIDGLDMWDMLNNDGKPVRTELLHNIDGNTDAAIRVGEYKLITGDISGGQDDSWYPCTPADNKLKQPPSIGYGPVNEMEEERTNIVGGELVPGKVLVNCGPQPANVSTNCKPEEAPCLYHISSDPCEYNNIASERPDLVKELLEKLKKYNETAVPPGNKPVDPNANPKFYGGAWVPWKDENSVLYYFTNFINKYIIYFSIFQ